MMFEFDDLDVAVDGAEDEAMARMMAEDAMMMAMEAGYDPTKSPVTFERGEEDEGSVK